MKSIISLMLIVGLVTLGGMTGCTDKTKVQKKTTVTTPDGSTTTTTTKEVEKKGDNPPPSNP